MTDLLRETISAAEKAAINDDSQVRDYIDRLLGNPADVDSCNSEQRAYLAVLLDSIGLYDESDRILHDSDGLEQVNVNAALRNIEGILATGRGDYERAQQALKQALPAASTSPTLRVKIEANLAAASLEAGALDAAEMWADAASVQEEGRTPASDVLVASVRAIIASAKGDLQGLRAASVLLGDASTARVDELGPHHPHALATVANMARVEIMLAHAEGSQVRLERAARVLEVTALRLEAELGASHPLSIAARTSLHATESAHTEAAIPMMKTAEAETEAHHDEYPAAGTIKQKSADSRVRRYPGRRSAGITDQAAASISVEPPIEASRRMGGDGHQVFSSSGSVATAINPGPHWGTFGGRGGWASTRLAVWTRAYLRQSLLVDLVTGLITSSVALEICFNGHFPRKYAILSLVLPVMWVAALRLADAYDPRFIGTGSDEFRKVLNAGVSLTAFLAILSYAVNTELSRLYLLVTMPTVTALGLVARYIKRKHLHRKRAHGLCMSTVVAVGHEPAVADLINELRRDSYHGLSVVATCLAGQSGPVGEVDKVAGVPVFGNVHQVTDAVRRSGADAVAVLSCPEIDAIMLRQLAWELEKTGTDLVVAPALLDVAGPRTTVRPTAGLTLLHVDHPQLSGPRQVLKGLFDRCVAGIVLILLSPALAAIAVAIRLSDKGPALFTQTRVGKNGQSFRIYKFRTMVVDAETRLSELIPANDLDGVLFKLRRDPRVTAIGARLRKWSVDELPQLINVVKGEMSLVGPRPALPAEAAQYADHVRRRLVVKPGLTGMWQVNGRSDLSWEESVRLDLRYVENWSFALDLQILWKTIPVILRGSGAY